MKKQEIHLKMAFNEGAKAKEEEILEKIDKNFHIVNNQGKDKPYKRIQISLPKWEKLKQELNKISKKEKKNESC